MPDKFSQKPDPPMTSKQTLRSTKGGKTAPRKSGSSPYHNRGQAKDHVLSVRFDTNLLSEIDSLVEDLRFNSRGLLIRQAVLDMVERAKEEGGYFAPNRGSK